ncbi:MAG: PAS domain S-box protein [Syntrophobacteraceae bacterium]
MRSRLLNRLVSKLIMAVSIPLLLWTCTWFYFNIKYQKEKIIQNIVAGTDRLSNTILLGTHFAMMLNSRDDITQIIKNISKQPEIENIRIFNKDGQIKFSNENKEIDHSTNIKDEACIVCHRSDPPRIVLGIAERTRIFSSPKGDRLLGIISPIYNDPGCSTGCHVHSGEKKILGALDLVVSLKDADEEILTYEEGALGLAVISFLLASATILVIVLRFVNRPLRWLVEGTRLIGMGNYDAQIHLHQADEMRELAEAINDMGKAICQKQTALNRKMEEFQDLFDNVPCIISVQDREYRVIRSNRLFSENFGGTLGEYCYKIYKGRDSKCANCPVERTFLDGNSHTAVETGFKKDGSTVHWMVMTSPVMNEKGEIVAAMEINLDITQRVLLEKALEESERKYHDIFNNIPSCAFVLDYDSLKILDINESVTTVYGYSRPELLNQPFMTLFDADKREQYESEIRYLEIISRVRNLHRSGHTFYVNMRVSPSEYPGQKVLLVIATDITKRLETEKQLIQAGKMATLGEMASGIAHELNQPLSVIKTAATFFIQKITKNQTIPEKTLFPVLQKIDNNVDRASKIITHMRQFARKSDITIEQVQLNRVLESAAEIFKQQLKLIEVELKWDLDSSLPCIMADAGRLEQVILNLLVNARHAIEARWEGEQAPKGAKFISIKSFATEARVVVEITDSGTGVPEEIAEKIFEPFFTTKKVGTGTGLGLSISYGIIQECGGDIKLKQDYTNGACFIITFPKTVESLPER